MTQSTLQFFVVYATLEFINKIKIFSVQFTASPISEINSSDRLNRPQQLQMKTSSRYKYHNNYGKTPKEEQNCDSNQQKWDSNNTQYIATMVPFCRSRTDNDDDDDDDPDGNEIVIAIGFCYERAKA